MTNFFLQKHYSDIIPKQTQLWTEQIKESGCLDWLPGKIPLLPENCF